MTYRTIPPHPSEFPRFRLVLPVFVPLTLVLVGWLASESGHAWNIHGDGALLMGAILLTFLVALCVTGYGFARGLVDLKNHPSLRSKANLGCVLFAAVVLAASVLWIVYAIATRHAT